MLWRAGRLAVGVWSLPPTPHPAHPEAPPAPSPSVSRHPSPRAGQLPVSLGHLCAALGLPATIVISTKGPPRTHHLPIIHSNQTPLLPIALLPPTTSLHLLRVCYTQAAAVFVCLAHPLFCYPHREAQLGKCGAFKKELPTH